MSEPGTVLARHLTYITGFIVQHRQVCPARPREVRTVTALVFSTAQAGSKAGGLPTVPPASQAHLFRRRALPPLSCRLPQQRISLR